MGTDSPSVCAFDMPRWPSECQSDAGGAPRCVGAREWAASCAFAVLAVMHWQLPPAWPSFALCHLLNSHCGCKHCDYKHRSASLARSFLGGSPALRLRPSVDLGAVQKEEAALHSPAVTIPGAPGECLQSLLFYVVRAALGGTWGRCRRRRLR